MAANSGDPPVEMRVTRRRGKPEPAAATATAEPASPKRAPVTRKRGRRAAESDEEETETKNDDDNDRKLTPSRRRSVTPKPQSISGMRKSDANASEAKRKEGSGKGDGADNDENEDDEEDALLASVSRETRKITSKRKRGGSSGGILAEFASLDALLSNDLAEKKRKAQRADKLKKLREEAKSLNKRGKSGAAFGSPMSKLMSDMEHSMSSLSADSVLFADHNQAGKSHEEKFGFVFTPITEPLTCPVFKATAAELHSDLELVYRAMQTTNDEELGALLWSKAILLRVVLGTKQSAKMTLPMPALKLPSRICSWLFMTMSTHSNSHIVKGCLSNLFVLLAGTSHQLSTELKSGLPCASFCDSVQDLRAILGDKLPDIQMEWRPTVYDFLNAFRRFGFQDSKRSMSARSKISTTPLDGSSTGSNNTTPQRQQRSSKPLLPFPTLNMQYVLVFLVLALRAKLLRLDGYDAFSLTMFFLRMQFEQNLHPEIVQLASTCIEELLEVFPTLEWRKEWGASLVLRIAGANEGLFDSAAGWLTVARRLPRTMRGTQLTTGLAIYVLQHRIDKTADEVSRSEKPLKFPIQSGLVLDIVAGIVEDLTVKYTEKKKQHQGSGGSDTPTGAAASAASSNGDMATISKDDDTEGAAPGDGNEEEDRPQTPPARASPLPPPPFDLLSKKIALMDLALQAFLNELTQKEMSILLSKLDDLTNAHKSTMNAKWHELKTLVSLMHRKYSLENLRVGRGDAASPKAKTVLFVDGDNDNVSSS